MLKETNQGFEIMTTRGCKGNCIFCHKLVNGLSAKTPDMILDEIGEISNQYGWNHFYFADENFIISKAHFRALMKRKKQRGMNFTFGGQCRIDTIDEDICKWGSENGFSMVGMGIESANSLTLKKMGKGVTLGVIERSLELLRKYQISVSCNFILGFAWDSEQDYINLISFIERNSLERQGKVCYLTPLPGTRLWKQCIQEGKIKDEWGFIKNLGNLFYERTINFTNLPDEVLDYYFQTITDMVQRPVQHPKSKQFLAKISVLY